MSAFQTLEKNLEQVDKMVREGILSQEEANTLKRGFCKDAMGAKEDSPPKEKADPVPEA
eukprot:gene12170-3582_t